MLALVLPYRASTLTYLTIVTSQQLDKLINIDKSPVPRYYSSLAPVQCNFRYGLYALNMNAKLECNMFLFCFTFGLIGYVCAKVIFGSMS